MKTNLNKNSVILLTAFFVVLLMLISCTHEDLGLPVSNIETQEVNEENGNILSEEELFLEMKAKQDKNPLKDINVRKAILHAIDRERIVDEIFVGYNNVSNSLFAEESPFWYPAWAEYDYNLYTAREFLSKAGYGPDNPLYITISAVNNSNSKQLIENIIREDLEKIGIILWIYNDPPKEFYQNHVYNGTFDLGLWSLYIFGREELECSFSSEKIPSMETEENTDCENFYWYSNTEVDNYLLEITGFEEFEIKREKIAELQEALAKDAVLLPLYSRLFVFAYDDSLTRIEMDTIKDRVFFDIKEWVLSYDLEVEEGEKTEIIIGYDSDTIDIFNGFEPYFLNDLLFKGLWKKNKDGSFTPELAEEQPELLEDDSIEVYINNIFVKLKDDIYWHDGDPITSEDVKYTFEYLTDFMEEKQYFSKIDQDHKKIQDIEIIDEKSFNIVFDEVVEDWQKLFPMIFKKDYFSNGNYDNLQYNRIISNGPYKVMKYDSDGELILEINEFYYNDLPDIERLIIRFDPDINNLIAMLKEGEINFLSIPVDPELMKMLEEENDINLSIEEGNLIEQLALSLKPKEE
jgi:ABC-type transport system substrate-binding protein